MALLGVIMLSSGDVSAHGTCLRTTLLGDQQLLNTQRATFSIHRTESFFRTNRHAGTVETGPKKRFRPMGSHTGGNAVSKCLLSLPRDVSTKSSRISGQTPRLLYRPTYQLNPRSDTELMQFAERIDASSNLRRTITAQQEVLPAPPVSSIGICLTHARSPPDQQWYLA